MSEDEDPFSCFDDDGSDSDNGNPSPSEQNKKSSPSITRDPSCGILAFHVGTEQALLKHVESSFSSYQSLEKNLADSVLECIDDFCMNRHWMMHIGSQKATILIEFVEECCASFGDKEKPLIIVELGTYCGYSSIMIANRLNALKHNYRLFSVEVVPENAKVAKEMVRLAGLSSQQVKILLLDPDQETLSSLLEKKICSIDFLFIDHDKSLYLADLQRLEATGWIQKGCYVAADNVVFADIDDYRDYIASHVTNGIVSSRLADAWLEYYEPDFADGKNVDKKNLCKDGVEFSIYLKSPPAALIKESH
jgi:catechol O-methyltransferase